MFDRILQTTLAFVLAMLTVLVAILAGMVTVAAAVALLMGITVFGFFGVMFDSTWLWAHWQFFAVVAVVAMLVVFFRTVGFLLSDQ